MSALPQEPTSFHRPTVVAVLVATTVAQVACVMGIAVFPSIAPKLAADMGVTSATIGYQMSLIYGAAAIASPLMSFTVPKWGAARTSQVGLLLSVLAMGFALTAWLPALAITSVFLGVAMTLLTPAAAHLLFRFSPPKNRNFIFSLKQTGVPLAWTITALAAPAITLAFGWRWAIAAILVVALACMLALERVRKQWDDDRRPDFAIRVNPIAGLAEVWRYPVLRWLSAASLCLAFVQLCVVTFLVTMLVAEANYSLIAAGVMLSLVNAAGVGGRVLWGWLADRTGDSLGLLKKMSVGTTAGCLVAAFLGPQWPTALVGLFFVVFGAAAVGWNGLFLAEVARFSPRGKVSVATSAAMTWNFAGILIGPALFATVFNWVDSYAITYGALSVVAAAAVAAFGRCEAAARRIAPAG
ncbi:MAG: MFS transporter [Burkholderiales bacterium]